MRQLLLKTQVVDVTLLDGGYRNNFGYSAEYEIEHTRRLYEDGVDYETTSRDEPFKAERCRARA